MTVVPFVRVPLTLATAFAFHVCVSPPTGALPPPRDGSEDGDRRTWIYVTARFIAGVITKGFYWGSAIADILVLLGPHVSTSTRHISIPTSVTLPTGPLLSLVSQPTLSLLTVTGITLALTGALLRTAAYRALGQFYACPPGPGPCPSPCRGPGPYTYRGARHAHALITSGPYAFLRHPGYAGLLLSTIGFVMLHLDQVGVGLGAGVPRWGIGVIVGGDVGQVCAMMRTVALTGTLLGAIGAIRRIQYEEQTLRERFKLEWEFWAEIVRYKLVPGVY